MTWVEPGDGPAYYLIEGATGYEVFGQLADALAAGIHRSDLRIAAGVEVDHYIPDHDEMKIVARKIRLEAGDRYLGIEIV